MTAPGALCGLTPTARQRSSLSARLADTSLPRRSLHKADFGDGSGERPTVPTKNGDDAILETYLKHANITGYYRAGSAERLGTLQDADR